MAEGRGRGRLWRVTLPGAVRLLLTMAAAAFAVTAVWLALDNPDIRDTSRSDPYTCLAPWDTVLNDADNIPGGEPPPDSEEIGTRCREAGHDRFALAIASGSAAVILGVVASVAAMRRQPATLHRAEPDNAGSRATLS